MTALRSYRGAGYVMANKATELFETFSLGYPSILWHLYASVAAAADKLVPWFGG